MVICNTVRLAWHGGRDLSETPRIFVSHSHTDDEFGLRLVADLGGRLGDDAVWYDSSGGLHGGDEWWNRIVAELTARNTFIVIFSPDAVDSAWVRDEINIAWTLRNRLGTRIIPVLWRPCDLRADWLLLQSVSFEAPRAYEDALQELLSVLGIPNVPVAPSPLMEVEDLSSSAKLIERLIHSAFGKEEWSAVITTSDLLVRETPENMTTTLWRERGQAFLALNNGKAAIEALDEVLQSDPNDVPTLRAKARALLYLGQPQDSVALLDRAYQHTPYTNPSLRLGVLTDITSALRQLDEWEGVLQRVDDALRIVPSDVDWLRAKLDALVQLSRDTEAYALARELAPAHLDFVNSWLQDRYRQFAQQAKWDEALVVVDVGLTVAPNDWSWLNAKATALNKSGQLDDALTYIRGLTERSDAGVEIWLTLAELAAAGGNETEVSAALESATQLVGQDNPAVAQARELYLAPFNEVHRTEARAKAGALREQRQESRIAIYGLANLLSLVAYVLYLVGYSREGGIGNLSGIFGVALFIYSACFFIAPFVLIYGIVRAIMAKQWGWAIGQLPISVAAFFVGLPFLGTGIYRGGVCKGPRRSEVARPYPSQAA